MRILIIDGQEYNLVSAKKTLGQHHELTLVSNIKHAFDKLILAKAPFDAICTDLILPLGDFEVYAGTQCLQSFVPNLPAGLAFALRASSVGIRTVLVVDADINTDAFCHLLFWLTEPGRIKNQTVAYVEARETKLFNYRWDETSQRIINCNDKEWSKWFKKSNFIIKDWFKAMKSSFLFTKKELGIKFDW